MRKNIVTQSPLIPSDYGLLQSMIEDLKSVPKLYRPGPYWQMQTALATREIKKYGLNEFRGATNSIGTSYADNAYVDIRGQYNHGLKAIFSFFATKLFPFSRMFDAQVRLTKSHFLSTISLQNQIANGSTRVQELLHKYSVPQDTTRGGCLAYCDLNGRKISSHYLALLDTHDILSGQIDFSSAKTFFEIGGGFGVNLHLLIENYPRLRKFVYLDIPPNLYVGTQYLKSFYGSAIKPYTETRNLSRIEFDSANNLEVLCIAPHQIERLNVGIDIFQNSASFVEMPVGTVQNYVMHIERLTKPTHSHVALVSYDGFDLGTTFHPDKLPEFFKRKFNKYEEPLLWQPSRKAYFYISKPS